MKSRIIVLFSCLVIFGTFLFASGQNNPLLIGVWGKEKGENAKFEIKSDSIYYVDDLSSSKYLAINDSLFVDLNGYMFKVKYKVTSDTLIFYRRAEVSKFVRFTE